MPVRGSRAARCRRAATMTNPLLLAREWLSVITACLLTIMAVPLGVIGALAFVAAWLMWQGSVELLNWGCR